MTAETILEALHGHKVRKAGPDRWRSICPVCGERNVSALSIGATADGAVLLHCFKSACSVESICTALGLQVADLFPPRESGGAPPQRRRLISPMQALELLNEEALIAYFSPSWTAFQADRGQHFSVIVDGVSD